jgi:hypothetical protein
VFGECCYDHAHAWSIAPLGAVTGAPTSWWSPFTFHDNNSISSE